MKTRSRRKKSVCAVESSTSTEEEDNISEAYQRHSTPKNTNAPKTSNTRSSERLRSRPKFHMPKRKDAMDRISDVVSPSKMTDLAPRRLINRFSRESHRYNADKFTRCEGGSSMDEFIVDEDEDDYSDSSSGRSSPTLPLKRQHHPIQSSSSSEEGENYTFSKPNRRPSHSISRLETDTSSSDDSEPGVTQDRVMRRSVLLESSSDTEPYDVAEASVAGSPQSEANPAILREITHKEDRENDREWSDSLDDLSDISIPNIVIHVLCDSVSRDNQSVGGNSLDQKLSRSIEHVPGRPSETGASVHLDSENISASLDKNSPSGGESNETEKYTTIKSEPQEAESRDDMPNVLHCSFGAPSAQGAHVCLQQSSHSSPIKTEVESSTSVSTPQNASSQTTILDLCSENLDSGETPGRRKRRVTVLSESSDSDIESASDILDDYETMDRLLTSGEEVSGCEEEESQDLLDHIQDRATVMAGRRRHRDSLLEQIRAKRAKQSKPS